MGTGKTSTQESWARSQLTEPVAGGCLSTCNFGKSVHRLSAVLSEKPSLMTLSHGWCFGTLVDRPPSLSASFPERENGYLPLSQNSPDSSTCSELHQSPVSVKPSLIWPGCPQECPLDDPSQGI